MKSQSLTHVRTYARTYRD